MYSVFTISNSRDVTNEFGPTNFRAGAKRPFNEAFPGTVQQPMPVPFLPQLRPQPVAWVPHWTLPVMEDGQATKRPRTNVAPVSQTFDAGTFSTHTYPTLTRPLPTLIPPPPEQDSASTHAPNQAMGSHAIDGIVHAEIEQGARLLGLEIPEGLNFMKKIFHAPKTYRNQHQERMDACKRVASLLATLGALAQEPEDKFPEALRRKLVLGMFGFLVKSFRALDSKHSSHANELTYQVMRMFNEFHPALELTAKYFSFNDYDDYKVSGGKRKFELLLWCSKKGIHLDEKKLNLLCKWKKNKGKSPDPSANYAQLCKASGEGTQT